MKKGTSSCEFLKRYQCPLDGGSDGIISINQKSCQLPSCQTSWRLSFIQGSPLIAKLFAVGFISSAALGAVAGRLCDKIGTRRGCLLYCVWALKCEAVWSWITMFTMDWWLQVTFWRAMVNIHSTFSPQYRLFVAFPASWCIACPSRPWSSVGCWEA